MKNNAKHVPFAPLSFALLLAPLGACGDDSGDAAETTPATTTAAESTSSTGEGAGSDSGATGESSSGDREMFADCSVTVLADDFGVVDAMGVPGPPRWFGPGADENGELIDDGESEYVVSVTYLALRPDADQQRLDELNNGNAGALFSNPGLVATQLGGSAQCASARTFTVWESRDAMMEFVASEAHRASIVAFSSLSRGGSTLSVWPEPVPVSEISWGVALERLSTADAYD